MINKRGLAISLLMGLLLFWRTGTLASAHPLSASAHKKHIVLIAGEKSHSAGFHEYIKTVRLLKVMLDESNVKDIETSFYLHGWPEDPAVLDQADLILFFTDGRDGDGPQEVPFMKSPERMQIMEKQMKRGCGFSLLHFSTFAPDSLGRKVLEWGGGYFDWQDEKGARNWYSSIKTMKGTANFPDKHHPIVKGVHPFTFNEEFYYNIRFNESDTRLRPVVVVPELSTAKPNGNTVAWAIQRKDKGRAFCTTMGHYYSNWENPDFRKLLLNGIVWAAGAKVPDQGVETRFYTDKEVTMHLYGKSLKALVLTGNNHPQHPWKETTAQIKAAIERDDRFYTDISTNIEDLNQYDLKDYDVLVMNYCNWEDSNKLSEEAQKAFVNYLNDGGGLLIIHFANGAFHYSLPKAGASDWPEYRKICRRVWDHSSNSAHDPFGPFQVHVTGEAHTITKGLHDFQTSDELYYNQKGAEPITPLLVATSKVTGKEEPLAWAYRYGKGNIFQTVLGHNAASFEAAEMKELIKNAAAFVARSE